jgi:hypothetical protein
VTRRRRFTVLKIIMCITNHTNFHKALNSRPAAGALQSRRRRFTVLKIFMCITNHSDFHEAIVPLL